MTVTRRRLLLAAGAGLLAAAAPASARPRPGPVALVTADLEAHIAAVDPRSLRVLRRIACPAGPRSIERAGRSRALVAHTDEGSLSLIDGAALRVTAVIGGLGEPRYAAVTADGALAYVTDSARGEVVTVDLARARVVRRTAVGGAPRHLGLTPDGRALWTALGNAADRVAVLDLRDPRRPRVRRTLRPPFPAHDVVAAPDDASLWVTSGRDRRIAVYARGASEPRLVLAADAAPQHVAFAGEVAYVASGDDGTLRAHRARDGRRMWTARVPTGSYNLTTADGLLVSPSLSRGTLAAVSAGARSAATAGVARSAHDACLLVR